MMEEVILVDEMDQEIGTMEKLEAHEKGVLHRAFSIFLFNDKDELLLQRRAITKYHSGGLWTNTCCSHPRKNETSINAAKRRLMEELGISAEMTFVYSFIYKAALDHELTEHELDHVFCGRYSGDCNINTEEVCETKYMNINTLTSDISLHPERYTEWFKLIMPRIEDCLKKLHIDGK
jgi:isopentenyl-diphosphate delta-isomerase